MRKSKLELVGVAVGACPASLALRRACRLRSVMYQSVHAEGTRNQAAWYLPRWARPLLPKVTFGHA